LKTKPITIILLTILLSTLATPLFINQAKAEPSFYNVIINSDGSIENNPFVAPITTTDNINYYLTGNFTGKIVVQRSNIVLDGAGKTLQGDGTGDGISLTSQDGVTITDFVINNKYCGIKLVGSLDCVISNNTVISDPSEVRLGITLEDGSNNNTVTENTVTTAWSGITVYTSNNNNVTKNNVTCPTDSGFGIKFANSASFNNASENQVSSGTKGFILDNSITNNTISNNIFTSNDVGISADYAYNNTITDNQIINSISKGIQLQPATNNTLSNNVIHGATYAQGIYIASYVYENSSNNVVLNNTIYGLHQGIYLQTTTDHYTFGNVVVGNNITATTMAMMIDGVHNNTICRNTITNTFDGICMVSGAYDNVFYQNNVMSFTARPVYWGSYSANIWDYGGQGNYWSNYLTQNPDAAQIGTTGIWNTPYTVENSIPNVDNYPLVSPVGLYVLNISSVGSGSPSIATGLRIEVPGTELTVAANTIGGKAFLNWIIDGSNSTDNPITVTMNANHNLQAVFEKVSWSLTVQAGQNGLVNIDDIRVDGTTVSAIGDGAEYELTAVADEGYGLAYWLVNGSEYSSNPLALTVDADYNIQAVFGPECSLTIDASTLGAVYSKFGRVDGTTIPAVNGSSYGLFAIADSGYVFSYWLVNGEPYSSDNPLFLTIDGDQTVEAVFSLPPLYILPTDPSGPTTDELLWAFYFDASLRSEPVVVDGVAYVSISYGYVVALNATTNLPIWVFEADDNIYGSPTVVDGVVYVGSDDEYLYALNATTTNPDGEVLWAYNADDCIESTVTVAGGVVYFGTEYGTVYALNANPSDPEGELLWYYDTDECIYTAPAVDNGVVYVTTEYGYVYALQAPTSGEEADLLWCFETSDELYSSPVVVAGVVYIGACDGYVYALDADTENSDGSVIWSYDTADYIEATPTVVDGVVYVGTESGCFLALNATPERAEGQLLWSYQTDEDCFYTGAVVSDGIVYVTSYGGYVYALNAAPQDPEGELMWSYETIDSIYASPALVDGVLYVCSTDGSLYAFAANSEVSFTVSGLEAGTSWTLTFAGIIQTSTANTITFHVCPNGEYSYSISLPDGYTTNSELSGTLQVSGEDIATSVTFAPIQSTKYTLTMEVYVDGILLGNSSYAYAAGEVRNGHLDELPAQYTFNHLSIDGIDNTETSYSIIMNSNHTLQLYFDTAKFQLTITTATGGITNPTENQTYNYGDIANVTATAAPGYQFSYWLIDEETNSTNPLSITILTNHTLTPVFTEIPTTIVATQTEDNTIYNIRIGGNITAQQMSNMTITPYVSNSTTKVAFTVTGPSGTEGFGTMTLPKEAVPYGTTPLVYIDDVLAEYQSYTQDDAYFYVSYMTHFSTHVITIDFTTQEPAPILTADHITTQIPQIPQPTINTTTAITRTPSYTPQPTPTLTPEPTTNPTLTTTQAGFPAYIAVIFAVVLLFVVAFGFAYKRHKDRT
jgi:parallel beta-helix repeat protein